MPGRLFLTTPLPEIAAFLGADAAGLAPDPPRHNIAPGQEVLVCPPDRRLTRMRWGLIPSGRVNARGRPVMETIVNARSGTVFSKTAFDGVARALVPADGWYEWTGQKRRKTPWRISRLDGRPLAFAAITDTWQGPGGIAVAQVAMVTCPPSGDVANIHDRMGVLLEPEQFEAWLTGDETAAQALMRPYPDGSLTVAEATDVDWSGA
ncbi:SOS response-associated peptidase [Psychromarinibacter sp. C21-152]|uniref:Abasic site processing protein n=1 Tax=Psychromarinibacter sediminicola TaxID=3033385 RepID=A0AAE3NZB6_9RHOB|nr:SOS response-associated peptidase [Psychromarinibacter sediminicola]MDF0603467.1 SOS response-associated peptidase [Psychromarinibacter sediminicola]